MVEECGGLPLANDREGQCSFPFTEAILSRPPGAGTVEPVFYPEAARAIMLQDLYCAKTDHHKLLRRLAGELLPECLCLGDEERNLALAGASMLVRMRAGDRSSFSPPSLTREAAQLFARLPEKTAQAQIVLEILSKFVNYIEDGIIDLSALDGPGVRRLHTSLSPTDPPANGRLKLVVRD